MSKEIVLRKSGNSLIFTAPADFNKNVGRKYSVTQKDDGSVLYTPVKHINRFHTSEFQNYDYQSDLKDDPEIAEVKPLGKEKPF